MLLSLVITETARDREPEEEDTQAVKKPTTNNFIIVLPKFIFATGF